MVSSAIGERDPKLIPSPTFGPMPKRQATNNGLYLASMREAAGVTLQQISDSTKISKTFLAAIEEGRFQELPGGVFARSYIRQYADAIGCDPDPILKSLEPPPPVVEAPARKSSHREAANTLVRFFSLG